MDYKKSIFDEMPILVENEGHRVRINFDVEHREMTTGSDAGDDDKTATRQVYAAYVVRLEQPLERDAIINAIVTAAYPQDKMQAIINNHLLDGGEDEEHEQEFLEMQQWRKHAKEVADKVMESL